jgi:hypothetical protein
MPYWVLVSGLMGVIVVVVCVILLARPHNNGAAANTGNTDTPTTRNAPARGGLLPPSGSTVPQSRTIEDTPRSAQDQHGQVYEGGRVQRAYEKFYVVLGGTPSQSYANNQAQFLADHGVDVSVEYGRKVDEPGPLYHVVSVQGFPSRTAATKFRDHIVDLGRLTPEYKKNHKGWEASILDHLSGKDSSAK